MRTRVLGPVTVSEIGLGAGPLGDDRIADDDAVRLIHAALDLGITVIDTAPSYGRSEHRIGAALAGRRDRVVVSTKLGYGVPGIADWTGACITAGIELALARLQTTWIDIAHLHSCPLDVLQRGDVIEALAAGVRDGKVRAAAYSGDNAELDWAIASGHFRVVQCSINVADQHALVRAVPAANARSIGVLAKRTLANAAWRSPERPSAPDRAEYWDRIRAMDVPVDTRRALAFVLAQPIGAALVGTTRIEHLRELVEATPDAGNYRSAFAGRGWPGVV